MIPQVRFLLFCCLATGFLPGLAAQSAPDWPAIDGENRVWTRWWWHGSAVTPQGITAQLTTLRDAGFGGVELTPIFGVIGEEADFVTYLSEDWMTLLGHTLEEAERLGLQVDMATGTGWPFGGPWVEEEDASKYLAWKSYALSEGERLDTLLRYDQAPILRRMENIPLLLYRASEATGVPIGYIDVDSLLEEQPPLTTADLEQTYARNEDLQALAVDQLRFGDVLTPVSVVAVPASGPALDVTDRVDAAGRLDWAAPSDGWKVFALYSGLHGKMVERAAPGGEGYVIDHFSAPAIDHYLARFTDAFAGQQPMGLRAFFNDSYEVDDARGQANWTPGLLDSFAARRGYDLRDHLPGLLAEEWNSVEPRVLSDFRETISDLLLDNFTAHWRDWAHEAGALVRNQSHGSPASILDLYAASDIPETEGTEDLRIRFASSAGHVAGKPLISAEVATWLGEHFVSTAADLKANVDNYLVNGVNHLVYHGNAYSPAEDPYPGRLFYAALHMNDRNPMWEDLKSVHAYVARAQSLLQRGSPDNDVLLYFPLYDRFATPAPELLQHFDGHGPALDSTPVALLGEELLESGFAFDLISDRQLQATTYGKGIRTAGATYQTVVVPRTEYFSLPTLRALIDLASAGATVIFEQSLPATVPGSFRWEQRQDTLRRLLADLSFTGEDGERMAPLGQGRVIVAHDPLNALSEAGIRAEPMVALGLTFTRRSYAGGTLYFIANQSQHDVDGPVSVTADGSAAVLYDPMTGQRGQAQRVANEGGRSGVRLQIPRGGSLLVWVGPGEAEVTPWPYFEPTGTPEPLWGPWQLEFSAGGEKLPESLELRRVRPWSRELSPDYQYFSGTGQYRISFSRPTTTATYYRLDLGEVFETARVTLNGVVLGTLIGPTYHLDIPADRFADDNELSVEVSNRMVNRIIGLDRQGVHWKKFYNTNFPAHLLQNRGPQGVFSAVRWSPVPSGLAGPVTLTPGTSAE